MGPQLGVLMPYSGWKSTGKTDESYWMPHSFIMPMAQSVFWVTEKDGARKPRTSWLAVFASTSSDRRRSARIPPAA